MNQSGKTAFPLRLLCLDIDGTLLNTAHQLPPENRAAVQYAAEQELTVCLMSARPPQAIEPITQALGVPGPVTSFGGALIEDGKKRLFDRRLPVDASRTVIDLAQQAGISLSFYRNRDWLVTQEDFWSRAEGEITGLHPTVLPLAAALANGAPHKLLCMGEKAEIALEPEVYGASLSMEGENQGLLLVQSSVARLDLPLVAYPEGQTEARDPVNSLYYLQLSRGVGYPFALELTKEKWTVEIPVWETNGASNVPAEETWQNMINGVSGAGPITHFDASLFKTQFACEVKNFNVGDYIDRKEARKMDLYTQYAIAAAKMAVSDSNMDLDTVNKNRIGVVFGVGIGGIHTFEEEAGAYALTGKELGPKYNPFFIPKMIADIASGHISILYGFHGPNYTTTSACASSTNALADAFNLIRLGKADMILSGGAEAGVWPAGVGGFNAMKALSTRNDDPQHASRPFSASRDGFVIGEGAGCLILEELEHAKARGAKIYAEMVGAGMSADAYHITASHPEGLGAKLVMQNALEDAGLKPEDIDYINVHGTSTHVGDISEAKAIKDVFGEHAYKLNISSTKSMTGHLLGAAGAVEALASVMAVNQDIVPPTINHEEEDKDEEIDYNLNFTFNQAQKRTVRAALSNTFGFGGHNACVIFKKYAE